MWCLPYPHHFFPETIKYLNCILREKSGMELHQRIRAGSSAAPARVPFPPNTVLPHYLDTAFQLSAQTAVLHIWIQHRDCTEQTLRYPTAPPGADLLSSEHFLGVKVAVVTWADVAPSPWDDHLVLFWTLRFPEWGWSTLDFLRSHVMLFVPQ